MLLNLLSLLVIFAPQYLSPLLSYFNLYLTINSTTIVKQKTRSYCPTKYNGSCFCWLDKFCVGPQSSLRLLSCCRASAKGLWMIFRVLGSYLESSISFKMAHFTICWWCSASKLQSFTKLVLFNSLCFYVPTYFNQWSTCLLIIHDLLGNYDL